MPSLSFRAAPHTLLPSAEGLPGPPRTALGGRPGGLEGGALMVLEKYTFMVIGL